MFRRNGPPFRTPSSAPAPQARKKPNYSIVIINHSGGSRQIEVTPAKIRIGAALAAGVLIVSGSVGALAGRQLFRDRLAGPDSSALNERVRALEEEVKAKDEALAAAKEASLKKGENPTLVSVPRPPTPRRGPIPEQPADLLDSDFGEGPPDKPMGPQASVQPPETLHPQERVPRIPRQIPIRFDAEDVTELRDGSDTRKVRFRLVKDRPDLTFFGYMFVYLETQDKRGKDNLFVYPKATRMGDADQFPLDFKAGEGISFRKNSIVDLPIEDERSGASLSSVSILLYNEDGKIVFQRRFERSDLKIGKAKERTPKNKGSQKGTGRTAL